MTRPWLVLAICCSSLFLVSMDVTIMNVALPAIGSQLDTSVAGQQWTVDGYTLVIASFLMLAGSTADRLGRRRVFRLGLALFSGGSLLCSLAPSIHMLVAFRIVQALGGAMLNPVAMSIIVNVFVDPRQRAQAIGVWGAVFGVSMVIGPPLGGFLVENVGWRSIFWINVPIGLAAIALATRYVPESRAERPRRPDLVGQTLIVIALATVTSGLIEGPVAGWDSPWIIAAFATTACAVVALVAYERRRIDPLIDLRFFRSAPFASATVIAVLAFTAFAGFLFINSLYLQDTRGLVPSRAGLCLLPVAVALVTCSPLSGRLVGKGKVRTAVVIAGVATAIGAGLLVRLRVDTPLVQLIVAYTCLGIGIGMVNAPITNAAVSGMPRAQAGVAAALASTSRQVGSSLGVALAGMLAGGGGRAAASSPGFALATHPFSYLVVGCGLAIVALGFASTGRWARTTQGRVSALIADA